MADGENCRLEDHLGRLYGYGLSLSGDPDEARDLVQETALRALGASRAPSDRTAYRAWLFRILRNAWFDRLRRRRTVTAWEEDPVHRANGMEYWQADERLINAVTVRLELNRLAPRHREIIGLIDIAGLSYAETAACLDIPVGTVMSRISRARQALIEAIGAGNVRALPVRNRRR